MNLLDDLRAAELGAARAAGTGCPACDFVAKQEDLATKSALSDALSGTIGTRKLAGILNQHGADFGRRTIERHRREEHRP